MVADMTASLFELNHYLIRRQVFKFMGASFHIYDKDTKLVGYSKQKAFKLKEDIRVFADQRQSKELLLIQALQVIDFSGTYDMVDSEVGTKVGTAQRKGFSSLLRDSWQLYDAYGQQVASLKEDSAGMAMMRRFLSNLIPQKFHTEGGGDQVIFKQHFNPFIYRLEVSIPQSCTLDRRLVLGTAVLIAAIEGRQR